LLICPHNTEILANPRRLLILASVSLFLAISYTLASARIVPRVSLLLKQFGYSRPVQVPLSSHARPLTNVSMAPEKYKKPPQAPPLFTGTTESLLADTKKLVRQPVRL
jgi:metallopeptidase MepB